MRETEVVMLKVYRARKHAQDLYEVVTKAGIGKSKSKAGDMVGFSLAGPIIPIEASLLLGDAIHNLRCALDQAVSTTLRRTGAAEKTIKEALFPTGRSLAALERAIQGRLKGAHPDLCSFIRGLEPFRGGAGHTLWCVADMDNRDKHRELVTCVRNTRFSRVHFRTPEGLEFDMSDCYAHDCRNELRPPADSVFLTRPDIEWRMHFEEPDHSPPDVFEFFTLAAREVELVVRALEFIAPDVRPTASATGRKY